MGIFFKYWHLLQVLAGGRYGENGARAETGDAAGRNGLAYGRGTGAGTGTSAIVPYLVTVGSRQPIGWFTTTLGGGPTGTGIS